jgi:hypothetical protein
MNIPPQFQWSPGEAATVNEFLNTPVGNKWISILIMRKPQLDLSSTEKAALSGAFAAGYESFLGQIGWTRNVSKPDDDAAVRGIDPVKD